MSEMRPDDSPSYSGPDTEYEILDGKRRPVRSRKQRTSSASGGFHDLDTLYSMGDLILERTGSYIADAEQTLREDFTLLINRDQRALADAQRSLWPLGGNVADFIEYDEYKILSLEKNRAADYIRKHYENALRGPGGTHKLDIMLTMLVINQEVENIYSFINTYLGDLNDSSEFRTVELFQEWALSALKHTGQLGEVFEATSQTFLNEAGPTEVDRYTSEEAGSLQSVFQVRVNTVNSEIVVKLDELRKFHFDHNGTFYDKYLGPALQFQLSAPRSLPTLRADGTALEVEAIRSMGAFSANMEVILSDQIKRNETFHIVLSNLEALIKERGRMLALMEVLTKRGKPFAKKFDSSLRLTDEQYNTINQTKTYNESVAHETFSQGLTQVSDFEEVVFPQHLTRDGDFMEGDLDLEEGVRVGGIIPSSHAHTGEDGSSRIRAAELEPNTLTDDIVDINAVPAAPDSLQVTSIRMATDPLGTPVAHVTISWDNASEDYTYEIQITEEEV